MNLKTKTESMISFCFVFFTENICYLLHILRSRFSIPLYIISMSKWNQWTCFYLHDPEIVVVLSAHLSSPQNYSRQYSIFLLNKFKTPMVILDIDICHRRTLYKANTYSLNIRTIESFLFLFQSNYFAW